MTRRYRWGDLNVLLNLENHQITAKIVWQNSWYLFSHYSKVIYSVYKNVGCLTEKLLTSVKILVLDLYTSNFPYIMYRYYCSKSLPEKFSRWYYVPPLRIYIALVFLVLEILWKFWGRTLANVYTKTTMIIKIYSFSLLQWPWISLKLCKFESEDSIFCNEF